MKKSFTLLVLFLFSLTILAWSAPEGDSKSGIYSDTVKSAIGKGKVVGLDNYYNNEWKKDKSGKNNPFHYLWEDRDESGFSDLKGIINNLGAVTVTLKSAPTVKELNKFSIYFIVDPDTPRETEKPNYIQPDAIKEIVEWVKKGGVLVMFGNDSINAEFEHWNQLAKNFGIIFEQVCVNPVTGRNWDMGKIDKFPDHPVFKNINQIYLKEISTLKLQAPAVPVLTRDKQVIMASAKVGKGFVFALGDPWLYNEYIRHSRLPEAYQDYNAGTNLFMWLLGIAKPVN